MQKQFDTVSRPFPSFYSPLLHYSAPRKTFRSKNTENSSHRRRFPLRAFSTQSRSFSKQCLSGTSVSVQNRPNQKSDIISTFPEDLLPEKLLLIPHSFSAFFPQNETFVDNLLLTASLDKDRLYLTIFAEALLHKGSSGRASSLKTLHPENCSRSQFISRPHLIRKMGHKNNFSEKFI